MTRYKIADIEGVGPKFAQKLKKVGVRSVDSLLKKGANRKGRKELAATSGIDESYILKWVNMADLYRVRGIGSEYSQLLEKSGVDSLKELRKRIPENLYAKMTKVNSQSRPLVRQLPGLRQVKNWINRAKKMNPKITY